MLHLAQNQDYPSALYMIATPIGNLADITIRALHVLSICDYIACEDTRHSQILLQNYGIKAKLIACHQHNQMKVSQDIVQYLKQGLKIAYISDAGTPGVSDPGSILVNEVIKDNQKVIPIGGISAPSSMMSVCGLEGGYYFAGFLPTSNKAKMEELEYLSNINTNIIFFESPNRIEQTLIDLKISFANRKIIIGRELSKKFEEIIYANVNDNIKIITKGEFCIVIQKGQTQIDNKIAVDLLKELIPELGLKKASKLVAKTFNLNAKDLYNQGLNHE